MSTVLCQPFKFYVQASNSAATAPASNLDMDEMSMVWRSANLTSVYIATQTNAGWNTVVLVGSNLRSTDTIRIRAAAVASDVTANPSYDVTINAWAGVAPTAGALSFHLAPSARGETYVRLDITSTGNPAGYVQAQRLVIGKRVETDGVNVGAEQTFEDTSVIEDGPGYTTIDEYKVKVGWKVTLDAITDALYFTNWFPLLRAVGKSKGFAFIPDTDSSYLQNQAIFARITSSAKGTSPVADFNVVELSLLSV